MDRRICIPLFKPLLDYGRLRKLMDSRDIVKIKAIRPIDMRDWACFKRTRYKAMLKSNKLKKYSIKSESDCDPRRTWRGINEHSSRKMGRSCVKELSLNGVCITNSTALSNPFNCKIPLNNGSSFQEHISGLSERFRLVPTDGNQVLSLFKKTEQI